MSDSWDDLAKDSYEQKFKDSGAYDEMVCGECEYFEPTLPGIGRCSQAPHCLELEGFPRMAVHGRADMPCDKCPDKRMAEDAKREREEAHKMMEDQRKYNG